MQVHVQYTLYTTVHVHVCTYINVTMNVHVNVPVALWRVPSKILGDITLTHCGFQTYGFCGVDAQLTNTLKHPKTGV